LSVVVFGSGCAQAVAVISVWTTKNRTNFFFISSG
jgi:hypothetical protein